MDVSPLLEIQPAPRAVFDRLADASPPRALPGPRRRRVAAGDLGPVRDADPRRRALADRARARARRSRRDLRAELGRVGERRARRPDRRRGVRADLSGVDAPSRSRTSSSTPRSTYVFVAGASRSRGSKARARRGAQRAGRSMLDDARGPSAAGDGAIRAAPQRDAAAPTLVDARLGAHRSRSRPRRCSTRAAPRATRRACRSRTATSARTAPTGSLQRAAARRGRPRPALAADEPHLRLRRAVPRQHRSAGRRTSRRPPTCSTCCPSVAPQRVHERARALGEDRARDRRARRPADALRRVTGGRLRFCLSGGAGLKGEIKELLHAHGLLDHRRLRPHRDVADADAQPPRRVPLRHGRQAAAVASSSSSPTTARSSRAARTCSPATTRIPAATAAAFTDDGWFRTGDVGRWTDDGFLQIIDRKKDILVTAGGKNVPPANIEVRFADDPVIERVVVYGDARAVPRRRGVAARRGARPASATQLVAAAHRRDQRASSRATRRSSGLRRRRAAHRRGRHSDLVAQAPPQGGLRAPPRPLRGALRVKRAARSRRSTRSPRCSRRAPKGARRRSARRRTRGVDARTSGGCCGSRRRGADVRDAGPARAVADQPPVRARPRARRGR